jgi:hypothetical protein
VFTLGSFLFTEVGQIFALFFQRLHYEILEKTGWTKFWAMFSQNHLVTLFLVMFQYEQRRIFVDFQNNLFFAVNFEGFDLTNHNDFVIYQKLKKQLDPFV